MSRPRGVVVLWLSMTATGVVLASCSVSDPRGAEGPAAASSADRARARAQRVARAQALEDQDRDDSPRPVASDTPVIEPTSEPEADEPEPVAVELDAGADDAAVEAPDAAPTASPSASAAAPALTPDQMCEKLCAKVVECFTTIMGPPPPGLRGEMTERLREECLNDCSNDIGDHLEEAETCLEIEDCEDFVSCVKALDD
jgi:hypothetical protein